MKKHYRIELAAILSVVVAALGCTASKPAASKEEVRTVPVRAVAVAQRNINEELSLTGTLKPQAQVQVVSEISARLMRLLKNEGAYVAKGEVIAVLDGTDAQLAHDRAAAAVAVAQANREHALAERDRAANLLKTGGITDKDNLAAQVNLQVAEASLRQTKAEQAIAAQQLARCQIRAPFSGSIAKRLVDQGSMLAVGTPVALLIDNSVLEFRGALPSSDFSKLQAGTPVQITVDAIPGYVAPGSITHILPLVDERSRSFEVIVQVTGRRELVSGFFARAKVKVRTIPDAIVVPPSSLLHDGSRTGVASIFVIENGKATAREVALGVEALDAVQVREGLKPGMLVVVDPPTTLASGVPVETSRIDR